MLSLNLGGKVQGVNPRLGTLALTQVTRHLLVLLWGALACSASWAEQALFSAQGYRLEHYRSPTPLQHEQAQVLDTQALQQLLLAQPHSLLINVLPLSYQHGRFIEDQPVQQLPGSYWLPNVGKGQLSDDWLAYLQQHLQQWQAQQPGAPLVFYCRSDCWHSWNAAKRAAELGFAPLYWYRDGVDAWQQAGLPLDQGRPEAKPETQAQ
ncbi:rhodanese-like domain-containing protein [Balneatrix alpica]|uniref:rhodanese-like domain-containing protein n=1 Tax=Balneatrix alpica TaxID=75684 RepID=UPI002738E545|nr:rhodanese-like domain-containing protein [Balneatrix alpica]